MIIYKYWFYLKFPDVVIDVKEKNLLSYFKSKKLIPNDYPTFLFLISNYPKTKDV